MRLLFAVIALGFSAAAIAQHKFVGSNFDSRVAISFKVPDAAVQKLLPEGWESNPPASGPAKGSNIGMTLIEQIGSYDADGKALPLARGIAVVIPARKKGSGTAGPMVVAGLFMPHAAPGAYGVYLPARLSIERRQRIDGDGKVLIEERWSAKGPDGHAIDVEVQYVRDAASRGKAETRVFSGARPDYFRIYQTETLTDVARNADGVDRVAHVSVRVDGEKLKGIFDGSQRVVSVTSIPSYARQVYLPAQ